jgi:hypothetical protein
MGALDIDKLMALALPEHQISLRNFIPASGVDYDSEIDPQKKIFPPKAIAHILGVPNCYHLMNKVQWLNAGHTYEDSQRGGGMHVNQKYRFTYAGLVLAYARLTYSEDKFKETVERLKDFDKNGFDDYGRVY